MIMGGDGSNLNEGPGEERAGETLVGVVMVREETIGVIVETESAGEMLERVVMVREDTLEAVADTERAGDMPEWGYRNRKS